MTDVLVSKEPDTAEADPAHPPSSEIHVCHSIHCRMKSEAKL